MKLNKDKWIKVDFKNIVICVDHHSKNPIAEGYNKYVGLENINGETLKIEGYGNVTDGTTFSKVFTEGDVLFGKRRAYLKKVAIADFNGICSSDILVFRPKVEFLNAKLLPFYVLSNDF
ncbi:MAG: type I restriction endonuclease subunit S, partial [bacterium]